MKKSVGFDDLLPAGKRPKFQLVDKHELRVDKSYQRDQKEAKSKRIAKTFDWNAFACLLVGRRADGRMFLIDGATRHGAALLRADILSLPCLVIEGTDAKLEAQIFERINKDRSSMRGVEQYRAMLKGGNPKAIALSQTLKMHGYEINFKAAPKVLNGPIILMEMRQDILGECLEFIKNVWPTDSLATRTYVVQAIAIFRGRLAEKNIDLNSGAVQQKFRNISIAALMQLASAYLTLKGTCSRDGLTKAIVAHWDKGRSSNRLEAA